MKIAAVFLGLLACIRHVCSYETAIESMDCGDSINAIDRAKLTVQANAAAAGYALYAVNTDCYHCAQLLVATIDATEQTCLSVWTPHEWKLYLTDLTGAQVTVAQIFGDQGEYSATVPDAVFTLDITETKEPVDPLVPLLSLLGILGFVAVLAFTVPALCKAYRDRGSFYTTQASGKHLDALLEQTMSPDLMGRDQEDEEAPTATATAAPALPKKPARLRSLDTFRGLSLLLMIFVNYGGGGYWFFDHAAWNGLTFADLLFPWFMWIMGVSMALSFVQQLPANAGYSSPVVRSTLRRVCVRSLKLFFLGMFLANGYDYTTWRIPGVLQYFAASYLLVSLTVIAVHPHTQALLEDLRRSGQWGADSKGAYSQVLAGEQDLYGDEPEQRKASGLMGCLRRWVLVDASLLSAYRYEMLIQLALLLIYLCTVFGAAVPGCPRGYNGPGGIGDYGNHHDCTGGIHRYLDLMLFTHKEFFHGQTCRSLYQCIAYDPEGLLGVLTATNLTFLGLMVGRILMHYPDWKQNVKMLLYLACFLLLVCALLCDFSQNEGIIPVNKNLWSLSFICVCGGLGIIGLIACYLLIDICKVWTGAPFYYLGMNSILIYMAHQLLAGYFPFSFIIFKQSHALLLTSNAVGVFSWCVIAFYFHRIKFFVKV